MTFPLGKAGIKAELRQALSQINLEGLKRLKGCKNQKVALCGEIWSKEKGG